MNLLCCSFSSLSLSFLASSIDRLLSCSRIAFLKLVIGYLCLIGSSFSLVFLIFYERLMAFHIFVMISLLTMFLIIVFGSIGLSIASSNVRSLDSYLAKSIEFEGLLIGERRYAERSILTLSCILLLSISLIIFIGYFLTFSRIAFAISFIFISIYLSLEGFCVSFMELCSKTEILRVFAGDSFVVYVVLETSD